jgi:predicted metal-dependent hydrolase
MANTLLYGENSLSYHVTTAPNLEKKIKIHVYPNNHIEVEAPEECSSIDIDIAVRKRARWIVQQLEAAKQVRAHSLPREYVSGETHFYVGRRFQLCIIESKEVPSDVKLRAGRIEIITRSTDPASVRRRLNDWYKEKSISYFQRRLRLISANISWIDKTPPFKLVPMKKQWGSCSPNGVIHLNPWLIRAPVDCIDYVITHELCHLREHNHSKKYYELLQRHYPDWQHVKAKLDGMAELLLAE